VAGEVAWLQLLALAECSFCFCLGLAWLRLLSIDERLWLDLALAKLLGYG